MITSPGRVVGVHLNNYTIVLRKITNSNELLKAIVELFSGTIIKVMISGLYYLGFVIFMMY